VVQPDVVLALGISGARTLAELALRGNRWFTPHTWTNGIGLLANLHVCCGVGGGPFLEFPYDPPGWTPERRDFMLAEPVRTDADGMLTVPTAPGMGIELDEDAVAHYRRMGSHMCRHLCTYGHHVCAFDVDRKALARAARSGARPAGSVAECVAEAEILITSLPGPPQVQQVLCGVGGVGSAIAALPRGDAA